MTLLEFMILEVVAIAVGTEIGYWLRGREERGRVVTLFRGED